VIEFTAASTAEDLRHPGLINNLSDEALQSLTQRQKDIILEFNYVDDLTARAKQAITGEPFFPTRWIAAYSDIISLNNASDSLLNDIPPLVAKQLLIYYGDSKQLTDRVRLALQLAAPL